MKLLKSKKVSAMIMTGVVGISLLGLTGCTINIGTNGTSNTTSNSVSSEPVKKTKNYSVGSYNLEIPEEYSAQYQGSALKVGHSVTNPTWMVQMQVLTGGNYSKAVNNQISIKSQLASKGLVMDKVETKTVGGVNFILYEGKYNGYNYIYAYGEATDSTVFYIAVGSTGTYDLNRFNEFAGIYAKAKNSSSNATGFSVEAPQLDLSTIE